MKKFFLSSIFAFFLFAFSLIHFKFQISNFKFAPPRAYAICNGDYECGNYSLMCEDLTPCSPYNSTCPSDGSLCRDRCEGGILRTCGTKSQINCDSGSGACSFGQCVPRGAYYGCYWTSIPPGPTATLPPGVTPTDVPPSAGNMRIIQFSFSFFNDLNANGIWERDTENIIDPTGGAMTCNTNKFAQSGNCSNTPLGTVQGGNYFLESWDCQACEEINRRIYNTQTNCGETIPCPLTTTNSWVWSTTWRQCGITSPCQGTDVERRGLRNNAFNVAVSMNIGQAPANFIFNVTPPPGWAISASSAFSGGVYNFNWTDRETVWYFRAIGLVPPPTPIPGRINVSFRNANDTTCLGSNSFPGGTNFVISTNINPAASCVATAGRFCSLTQTASNVDPANTYPFSNLYVDPITGSSYQTTVSLPSDWIQCSPSGGGAITNNLSAGPPSSNYNQTATFAVTQRVGSWFQTLGGNVHFNDGTSTVNAVTTENFNKEIGILSDIGLISSSSNGGFTCNNLLTSGSYSCHPDANRDWILYNNFHVSSAANPTTYADFWPMFPNKIDAHQHLEINNGQLNTFFNADGTYDFLSGNDVNFNADRTIDNKLIFFVDGDITFNKDLNIDQNGFLAVFATGNIIINDSSITNISGIFVTDGSFVTTGSSDTPLDIFGTVVADNISNGRTVSTAAHSQTTPTLRFNFNPQLILNMPDSLKHSATFKWNEISR